MLQISGQSLPLSQIASVAAGSLGVDLAPAAARRVAAAREVVERVIREGRVVYGVNTGFGRLAEVNVSGQELEALQLNLVRSHSCGVGPPLAEEETRALMLLRANVLARGNSGCRVEVIEMLLAMLAARVHAVIPEKGSVGASGDLAPLAHLALSMIGEGEAFFRGARIASAEALRAVNIQPLRLAAKEGLALLNGTQAMTAAGGLALFHAQRLAKLADLTGAMTLEALRGTPVPFDERIHSARPHAGQVAAAAHLRNLLGNSEIRLSHVTGDHRVQDAYSLRCMPQVHGAVRDALAHAQSVIEIETGSATDNPLVFTHDGEILSGGNFHGAPVAMVLDYCAIALTDLISIAERRIDRLVNPHVNEGLPPFLSLQPGVSSGFMMAQVCAAALLNHARVLAHPASVDNVPTSGDKEDHVSMGMTAALKLREIVRDAEQVLAIELLTAAEGLTFRRPLRSSEPIERALAMLRRFAPRLSEDRVLSYDIERTAQEIRAGRFDEFVDK
ncbi:MAG: histidine ammonia-lyase [Acidobacteriaceae bacterium]|nr:histidine ammonia-lyase [Acidobacteriaceae bacterium]